MAKYFIGWDVGAWHCEKNQKSKDCICVIEAGSNKVVMEKRKCIRNQFNDCKTVYDFLNKYFDDKTSLKTSFSSDDTMIFAIDAVFRWPIGIQQLFCDTLPEFPESGAIKNVMLYRYTERFVSDIHKPRSAVQDMIGSQSTKIMYFLQKYEFKQGEELGVWETNEGKIKAIETYPAVLGGQKEHTDNNDSELCAELAQKFDKDKDLLCCPENQDEENWELIQKEGWIWFPKDRQQNLAAKTK